MDNNIIYKIHNLDCKYSTGSHAVLKVDYLKIDDGEIVFFIGSSGVGKSTLLETLGLMNKTIYPGSDSSFLYRPDTESEEDYLKIWDNKESYLAEFRKKYLSFIFQSTNLFDNLSAKDNVLLTPLLQGMSLSTAESHILPLFKGIFENEYEEMLADKKISEMSGGQRQRLAFVRSIASDYKILFADEPTGNLDYSNAKILMNFLINDIRKKKSTAIIVSHDIDLSVSFADKIVFIDKKEGKNNEEKSFHYGTISESSTYVKNNDKNWILKKEDGSEDAFSDDKLKLHLKQKL